MALSGFLNASFKDSVFTHMLNRPLGWFDKRGPGLITTCFSSVSQIRDILSDGLVTMLIDAYKQIFSTKMSGVADALMQLKLLKLHAETVGDILSSEKAPAPKGPLQMSSKPTLSLRELTYRHLGSETHTLKGFSLEVGRGEIVGITEPFGAGKSTLLNLLTGARQADSGQILIDGIDISKMPPKDYRTALSVVLRDDSIFTGTVLENITMFEPAPSMSRAVAAAQAAAFHEDILDMPMRYHTHIFAGSLALRGGQRQRFLLARAFYKNAPALVLYETTCHLDVVREKQVVQAIRSRAMTTLMVAHHKETLDGCDLVVRLEKLQEEPQDLETETPEPARP